MGGGNTVPKHIEVNELTFCIIHNKIKWGEATQFLNTSKLRFVLYIMNSWLHINHHIEPPLHTAQRCGSHLLGMGWICDIDNTILNYKFQVFNVLGHNQMI